MSFKITVLFEKSKDISSRKVMFYKACITFCLAITIVHLSAQLPLYMPRNVAKAYQKRTRQIDGKPGKNYWQNHGVYDIKINVSPPCRKIEGKETICYTNKSPDTISTLVIKLILNIHKLGAQRSSDVSEDYLNKGIRIDEVTVDGKK